MNRELTLGDKLKDLRVGHLTLADLSEATGISVSTLQRMESDDDIRVGYQDIAALARFYNVSADFLFGLTDNRQYRNIAIDKLRLSDEAVAILANGKLNNRLLCEMITHPDFPEWLAALEVYLDRKVLENLEVVNASYKIMLDTILKTVTPEQRDEYIATLKEGSIDGDDYLRFRLSQRFDKIARAFMLRTRKRPRLKRVAVTSKCSPSSSKNSRLSRIAEAAKKRQNLPCLQTSSA